MIHQVYCLRCPIDGDIRYIGCTTMPLSKRLSAHYTKCLMKTGTSEKDKWVLSLRNKNLKPIIELIEETDDINWEDREQFWIKYGFDNGFKLTNVSNGGKGPKGYKPTEERLKHMSKVLIGNKRRLGTKNNSFVRRVPIEIVYSKENIKKRIDGRAKAFQNRKIKGMKTSKGATREVLQFSIDGTLLNDFISTTEASQKTGVKRTSITENLRGKSKSSGGFVFKFKYPK